jgi:hypothetical protein
MNDQAFEGLEQALKSGGPEEALAFLAKQAGAEKNYPLVFEARLMQKRRELGLPLIQTGGLGDVPEDRRPAYEQAYITAAQEVGGLFLADGDIARAWSYFRAIGEPAMVAEAIEQVEAGENIDRIIEIAFLEGVNPRKGFELLLGSYGLCRAISTFSQYPARAGRIESLHLLVRTLYRELAHSLKRTIEGVEGQAPATESVSELMHGRDWLFEGNTYYVDTSHLASIVQFSPELEDPEMLARVLELTEYGKRLAPMFQFRGNPPFEDVYQDHGAYLRALLGQDVENAIAHFREKITAQQGREDGDTSAAQALVGLLARLKRYEEAVDISLAHLREANPVDLACPTAAQLCQMARDYGKLRQVAREQKDLLSYAAGVIQEDGYERPQ